MNDSPELAVSAFEKLLSWLDADREAAGIRYEEIRRRLVRLFTYRGCADPELLADRVFDRVLRKIDETVGRFDGEPARHFFSVANFIFLEYRKRPVEHELPDVVAAPLPNDDEDRYFRILRHCLDKLPADRRRIIVEYYRNERREKIEHRLRIAESLGISVANLHSKAFRIRASLQDCVRECLARES